MRLAFPDAIVTGWEPLEGSYGLPDSDDEHVLAAAATGGASLIATENTKDFPTARIPDRIHILNAADFAEAAASLDPTAALRALHAMSSRYTSPPRTPAQIVELLEARYQMFGAAKLIRSWPLDHRRVDHA